jgi:hypothetical protein
MRCAAVVVAGLCTAGTVISATAPTTRVPPVPATPPVHTPATPQRGPGVPAGTATAVSTSRSTITPVRINEARSRELATINFDQRMQQMQIELGPQPLALTLRAEGPGIGGATRYRNARVTAAVDETGTSLAPMPGMGDAAPKSRRSNCVSACRPARRPPSGA